LEEIGKNWKDLATPGGFAARDPGMLRPTASMSGMKTFEAPANPAML
jgi:hypothetical protein